VQMLTGGGNGGVEALQVADLHDATVLVGQFEDAVCLFEARCEGLFDQEIHPCGKEGCGSRGVMDGRDADRRGIEVADCGETRLDGLEAGDTEFCGGFGNCNGVTVDHGDEFDWLTFLLELMEDTKMVAPKRSRSDDCDAQWLGSRHYFFSAGASTA
jgi:hypothetical protein